MALGDLPGDPLYSQRQQTEEEPQGLFRILDFALRPSYASNAFLDTLADQGLSAFGDALLSFGSELVDPQKRLQFSDLIKKNLPGLAAESPLATSFLGFAGDLAFDPTTYVGFGIPSTARKIGTLGLKGFFPGRALPEVISLSKKGSEFLGESMRMYASPGMEITEQGIRHAEARVLNEIFNMGRSELQHPGGIAFAGQKLVPGYVFSQIADAIGLNSLKKMIKDTKVVKDVVSGKGLAGGLLASFTKKIGRSPEFLEAADLHLAKTDKITKDFQNVVDFLNDGLSEKEGIELQQKLHQIDSATATEKLKFISELKMAGVDTSKYAEDPMALMTHPRIKAVRGQMYDQLFTPGSKERRVAEKLLASYADLSQVQYSAGLYRYMKENLTETVMKDIFEPKIWRTIKDTRRPIQDYLTPEEILAFDRVQAQKYGTKAPDLDALMLYQARVFTEKLKMEQAVFKTNVLDIYGAEKMEDLSRMIQHDMRFFGSQDMPAGQGPVLTALMKGMDKFLRFWKPTATIAIPRFGFRQMIQNPLQATAELSIKALGMYSPDNMELTLRTMLLNGPNFPKLIKEGAEFSAAKGNELLPGTVLRATEVGPVTEKLIGGTTTDIYGIKMKNADLVNEAFENDVIRAVTPAEVGFIDPHGVNKILKAHRFQRSLIGREFDGLEKVFLNAINYTNFPRAIETQANLSTYFNARRLGYGAKQAAKMTKDAYFDYNHGLAAAERWYAKRIIPFYSFNRFVIPLIGRTLLKHPGRIAGTEKLVRSFLESVNSYYGGNELTPAERSVLPGYLMENPSTFAGFDEQMRAVFKSFNNFNFLDMLGTIKTDKQGKLSIKDTIDHAFMAQLAPMIKMPIEYFRGKDFFTGRALEFANLERGQQAAPRKLGEVTPEGLIGNIVGILSGGKFGAPGLVGGKLVFGTGLSQEHIKAGVKKLLGWEEFPDPRTGKMNAYINPWLAWGAANFFPSMQLAIRVDDPSRTPTEKFVDMMFGVTTSKLDLQQQAAFKAREEDKALREARSALYSAFYQGQKTMLEVRREEYLQLLLDIAKERAEMTGGIR